MKERKPKDWPKDICWKCGSSLHDASDCGRPLHTLKPKLPTFKPSKKVFRAITDLIRDKQIAIEKLTREQVGEALIQAIQCGDFLRNVRVTDNAQFVDYVPFRREQELLGQIEKLRAAIIAHRSQKADDRCIEDDDRLYEALGDGIKCDRAVGDKAAMLRNCQRFIERRCEGGKWPSYAELESRLKAIAEVIEAVDNRCAAVDGPVRQTIEEIRPHELVKIYELATNKP